MAPSSLEVARLGLFTSQGCKHCRRAKALLKEKSISYKEVDLTKAQRVRKAVQEYTGRRTVPQIFIAQNCIGGADELYSLEERGELDRKLREAEERGQAPFPVQVEALVSEAEGDGGDTGGAAAGEGEGFDWKRYDEILSIASGCPFGSSEFGAADLVGHFTRVDGGRAAGTEAEAWALGQELLDNRLVEVVGVGDGAGSKHRFGDDPGARYRFTFSAARKVSSSASGRVFNRDVVWPVRARSAPVVAESLRTKILDLYETFLSEDGKAVDYAGLARSGKFADYVRATSELREVDVSVLSRPEKIAFFVNVYNALVVHATATVGAPASVLERAKFFGNIKYEIGGLEYSCDDVEHGILRGNAVPPSSVLALVGLSCLASRTFKKSDPRAALAVSPVDPRIHFALVCGAKSCPPIRLYSAENLEEGLQGAAEAFCESEVVVDLSRRRVTLSKIFKWYGKDFAKTESDLLQRIEREYFSGGADNDLSTLLRGSKYSVKYAEYNWDVNDQGSGTHE
ncbi:DUF547 domain-containing protein [Chloropicon primus]|uniref:DUF547 domain-containing protein n=1 Tax=Chloropicon primus TaxID=1764295 RepID=A0A5B8MLG8_9CHLO|nr:DUF547 domain-containing protein [Chloropicon primus]UPQ99461.1 DUF547 domain-containing protein [Chloropicon primus]|eukprot:QDZ20252.1 DUF547 domain-containing protein [Chloropicon primus]